MPRSRGSSPVPQATVISQATHRSGWLGGLLPVKAFVEGSFTQKLRLDAEEAEEVEEDPTESKYWQLPLAFNCPRHSQAIVGGDIIMQTWRMRERMKTVSVALVICLNVGVDPPDVTKTQPCARTECWVDPMQLNPQRALEIIGNNLQRQYERWQPRARYRQSLDPTVEEVRRLATGLRRSAREERVLFHYNGHGVPRPTSNGEIWVFNRSYTQYIPLSIYDLQSWMGSPSIYVYDCSNAGLIVESFKTFADQHEREYREQLRNAQAQPGGAGATDLPLAPPSLRNCIQLAACSATQLLPMNPDLPADLFTACLTTPIKVALRWFVMQNSGELAPSVNLDQLEKIPGQFGDRRTMLGELNWIFTAITDTIAWNTLPRDTFQKLFRQDLLVASLFRNYLLAERIMRSCDCSPVSQPELPLTHQHTMWNAWDLAVDMCLSQLKDILEHDKPYVPSTFFEEQLTAFEVWLSHGCEERSPPEQLPIVLQVLLSQAHRLRALDLLGRFLDLGPWAVNLALSVGIFPYVLKLLQASARELRPLLVFIWAKILAVDTSCQQDLIRDQSHRYFLSVLQDPAMLPEHKTWSVFVLASVVQAYKPGQDEAVAGNLISICLDELEDKDPVLRQWLAICLGRLWDRHEEARWRGARDNAQERLYALLGDQVPEVRAAAVYALGTFLNACSERSEHANSLDHNIALHLLNTVLQDGSPLVRRELVVALQWVVNNFMPNFVTVCKALQDDDEERHKAAAPSTLSPNTGLRRASSQEHFKPRPPSSTPSLPPMHGSSSTTNIDRLVGPEGTPRKGRKSVLAVNSNNMTGILPSTTAASFASLVNLTPYTAIVSKFKPFYVKVWGGLLSLEKDPDTMVASMSRTVLDGVWKKMVEKERSAELFKTSSNLDLHSVSAPSSPARPSFMLGESPPSSLSQHNMSLPVEPISKIWNHMTSSTISEEGEGPSVSGDPVLSTQFIEWSARYFSTQLMRLTGNEDRESRDHWDKEWMYTRNSGVVSKAAVENDSLVSGTGRLDEQLGVLRVSQAPAVLAFHPYTGQLVAAGRDMVTVWESVGHHQHQPKSHHFGNKNLRAAQITALEFLNNHEAGLLATGADDGTVRVYQGWDTPREDPGQVTGWSLLPELVPQSLAGSRLSVGMCLVWDQAGQLLAGAGDSRVIRVWDCNSEAKLTDLPTASESFVTSLALAPNSPPVIAAAFGDGSIKIFDHRLSPNSSRVMSYREHGQFVLSCRIQSGGRLVSGCTDGVVKVWDMRRQASTLTITTGQPIITLDIHPVAPLYAAWTVSQQVSLHSLTGTMLNQIRYHEGLLGQRLGPVNCLQFHPHLLQLATGSTDSYLSLYGFRKY